MYATHHKTGRKVRILNHSTSHYRSAKTVVWLNKETDTSLQWNKYEVGVVGSDTYNHLQSKIDIDIIVCLDKNDTQWIEDGFYKNVRLVFASKEVLEPLGINFFKEKGVNNILCLDELHLLYSYIETQWDNSVNDACILVAILLRFCVSFPLEQSSRNTFGLKLSNILQPPPKLVFITQYYKADQSKRRYEIDSCLNKNIENNLIDSIVLLNEKHHTHIVSSKVSQIVINKRLHYNDVIKYIKESSYDPNTIIVFANADIYLDSTARLLYSVNMNDIFFALLRYENEELFGPRSDSQDTWIVNAGSIQSREWNYDDFHFSFGEQGCDNAITTEMLRMKFKVVNPSLSVKTHHIHESNIRSYDTDKIVEKNVYLYVEPTGLHDMEAITNFDSKQVIHSITYESFERPVKSNKEGTFCKMIEKQKRYNFEVNTNNIFAKQKVNIYKENDMFQTNTGLVYKYNKIYIGNSVKTAELWSESKISTLSPCISVKKAYIAPYLEEYTSVENYILYYLPKILYMRELYGNNGDFWAPNSSQFIEALNIFNWNQKNIPVLPSNELQLVFCKEAYIIYPSDTMEITKEDITILRKHLIQQEDCKNLLICMDEQYIDGEIVKILESELGNANIVLQTTSIERKIQLFQKASTCILYCNSSTSWAWKHIWALNPKTNLFIIQNEMELNGEVHHLASACELDHQIYVVPKGSLKPVLPKIINELKGVSNKQSDKPVIYVPKSGHAGDSFREMIDLWEEKQYITKVYSDCTNVWMNSIGDTLLYDRPNYNWIKQSDQSEQSWKKALFGNPKPIGNNAKSWSFWARRPRLLEEVSQKSVHKTKQLVFYGKIENAVQRINRTSYDWSTVCDISEFIMVSENTQPKLTEYEYLLRLAEARYGLCLAGFGNKCHREIECMALGTVPVCASEVDMDSYANPPVEGVHYIRINSPDEIKETLSKISNTQWQEMSDACKLWWKINASCEGLWNLTNKLLE